MCLLNTCVHLLEYYDLVNVSQPVIASYNSTHYAVTLAVKIKKVGAFSLLTLKLKIIPL